MKAAIITALALAAIGFVLLVAGVYVLVGTGWALIAGAGSSFAISGFIRQGLFAQNKGRAL